MIPIIPIITAAISAFGDKKVPYTAQTVKEFTASKTNTLGGGSFFGMALFMFNREAPNDVIMYINEGIGYLSIIMGLSAMFIKDAIVKLKTP